VCTLRAHAIYPTTLKSTSLGLVGSLTPYARKIVATLLCLRTCELCQTEWWRAKDLSSEIFLPT